MFWLYGLLIRVRNSAGAYWFFWRYKISIVSLDHKLLSSISHYGGVSCGILLYVNKYSWLFEISIPNNGGINKIQSFSTILLWNEKCTICIYSFAIVHWQMSIWLKVPHFKIPLLGPHNTYLYVMLWITFKDQHSTSNDLSSKYIQLHHTTVKLHNCSALEIIRKLGVYLQNCKTAGTGIRT